MHAKLENIKNWIEFHKKEVIFAVIIFVVAAVSFGFGYLANHEYNHAPIIIKRPVHEKIN